MEAVVKLHATTLLWMMGATLITNNPISFTFGVFVKWEQKYQSNQTNYINIGADPSLIYCDLQTERFFKFLTNKENNGEHLPPKTHRCFKLKLRQKVPFKYFCRNLLARRISAQQLDSSESLTSSSRLYDRFKTARADITCFLENNSS